jgi:hypothetical protein
MAGLEAAFTECGQPAGNSRPAILLVKTLMHFSAEWGVVGKPTDQRHEPYSSGSIHVFSAT